MTNGTSRPRKQFLDILRVLATCAVVMMHVLTGATDVTDASILPEYRGLVLSIMDLVTWCVPVFLLISGYLFLHPERELTYPVMIGKYCRRIALAILLFGVPYAASELVVTEQTFRIGMLPEAVWMTLTGCTWSHMWYLYLILFLYLITPLLKKVLQILPVWCIRGMLTVIFLGSSVMPFLNRVTGSKLPVLPEGSVYLLYYVCGYLFARREACGDNTRMENEVTGTVNRSKNRYLPAVAVVLTLGMIFSRAVVGFPVQMAYNYPFTVVLALLLFAMGQQGSNGAVGHRCEIPWQKPGMLSFAVYLVHPVYINLFYKFMKITPFTLLKRCGVENAVTGNIVLLLLLFAYCIVVLLLSTITAWVLRKIPVLRKYVL